VLPARELDRIRIFDLALRCVIGITPDERREKQDIIINLTLWADLRRPGRSDRFEDCVDYKALKRQVIALVESSSFRLIERLAERIAEVCLTDRRIRQVAVSVQKPGALRFARSVGVEITRKNKRQ
jgi:FolB domain-containing protein